MSNQVPVELRIKVSDAGASSAIDKVAKHVEKITRDTEQRVNQSNNKQRQSYERLSLAREQLGMRSESKIREEMRKTVNAYQELRKSGTASQDELTRAAEKTRQKITRLTNEMGKLTAEQQKAAKAAKDFETAQGRIRAGVAVGAGVAAAGYALKAPVMTAMSFDERLASMANTAFPERNASGRLQGAKELEAVINRSVDLKQGGGGTRDQAAEALDALIAKGTLSREQSLAFLPTVMRTAYGSSAAPVDIANLASALVGQNVVGNERDLKRALNMITASGQAGGFEIKDMARALPGQLAVGKTAGLVGLPGLQKILTMNQAAIMTAGDTSTAGNNVLNLLTKLSSNDTAKDFDKAGGGDLNKFLIDQRIKGINAVDAWLNLIDKISARDPKMKAALAKLNAAGNKTDQQAAIESISQLAEGGVIGRFFQDMQARGALFGMRNKALTDRVGGFISRNDTETGANDINYQTMAGTGAATLRNAEQEAAIRQKEAMDKLIPTITKAAEMFVDLSQKYPSLSAAVVGATPPIIALGTAAGVSAWAMGGGKFSRPLISATGQVIKGGAAAGLYGAGAMVGDMALDAVTEKDSAINRYGKAAMNGAAYGAVAGNLIPIPGVGAGIGALAGGGIGLLYEGVGDMLKYDAARAPQKVDAHLTLDVAPGLVVKRKETGNMSTTINQSNTGNIRTGAPGSP
ncbi:phage tail tape measure protein [Methylomonas rapida]|uniref:Phage tail tape measure protein n=1 Tax=Methylomonas rapida TaxID=2963939 RepID=A0ABY7GLT8_9GAMM|nr:phage tail tape measure protein [Methylomonas rapida]WAR45468.1 phage tail tape measure protein [Methylomonas rapida]